MNSFVLAWCTDIHLNYLTDWQIDDFSRSIVEQKPDALLITGDISEAPTLRAHLEQVADGTNLPIYFVLGNHDYYRSSIDKTRTAMANLSNSRPITRPPLSYLPCLDAPVKLTDKISLIGVDGWADGILGNAMYSRVGLTDWVAIDDLRVARPVSKLLSVLKELGRLEALRLEKLLRKAIVDCDRVIVAIHIPPWKEAAWHQGKHSDDDWLPWFSNKQAGDAITTVAAEFPDKKFEVYCGHSHGQGYSVIAPNVVVTTGSAQYGSPKVNQFLKLKDDGELFAMDAFHT